MKTIILICLALLLGCLSISISNSQVTVAVPALDVMYPAQWPSVPHLADATLFESPIDRMRFGYQWDGASYLRMNQCYNASFYNGHWSFYYGGVPSADRSVWTKDYLRRLDTNQVNYLGWSLEEWRYRQNDAGNFNRWGFMQLWLGYRWEPAENGESSRTWQPRIPRRGTRLGSWPYGFSYRHDSVRILPISDTNDANYGWLLLDSTRFGSSATRILDNAEPRVQLFRMSYKSDIHERHYSDSTDSARAVDNRFSGNRMILAVTLRRLSPLSTETGTDVVLRLKSIGRRFIQNVTPLVDTTTVFFNFITRPIDTLRQFQTLRNGRGLLLPDTVLGTGEYTNDFVVTRNMLPSGTDRDVTIYAQFVTDTLFIYADDDWRPFDAQLKTPRAGAACIPVNVAPATGRIEVDTLTPYVEYMNSASVAIKSISIVTPYTFEALCGRYDSILTVRMGEEVSSIMQHQTCWRDSTFTTSPTRALRIGSFYVHDEYTAAEELGMFYRSCLLNHLLTSECDYSGTIWKQGKYQIGDGIKRIHMFPTNWVWMTGVQPTRQNVATPMSRYAGGSWTDESTQMNLSSGQPWPTLGLKRGINWAGTSSFRNYETQCVEDLPVSPGTYITMNLPASNSTWLDELNYMDLAYKDGNAGIQPIWEMLLRQYFYNSQNWYFSKSSTRWMCELFYHHRLVRGKNNHGLPYAQYINGRPMHGNEARLEMGAAIAFGAKGFIIDKLHDLPASDPDFGHPEVSAIADSHSVTKYPGMVIDDHSVDLDVAAGYNANNVYRHPNLGNDYIGDGNDFWNMHQYVNKAYVMNAMNMAPFGDSGVSKRIYTGNLSVRTELKRIVDLVMHPDWTNHFWAMRPIAWAGYGYSRLVKNDTILSKWLNLDSVPNMSIFSYSGRTKEPYNERLVDFIIHDESPGETVRFDSCVIAVTNRRTAPTITDELVGAGGTTLDTKVFTSVVIDSLNELYPTADPLLKYRQDGARRITIPIRYHNEDTMPRILHIQEMSLDTLHRIDTIVGAICNLVVDFEPGQTRFFRVIPVSAEETSQAGFLNHSNQRKIVAFPTLDEVNEVTDSVDGRTYRQIVAGDTMRYHQVFHRRQLVGGVFSGILSVYYRRSRPIITAARGDDAYMRNYQVEWEREMLVSDSNRYFHANRNVDTAISLSCGYPSLVVRPVLVGSDWVNRVFVVYACDKRHTDTSSTIWICESMFLADGDSTIQRMDHLGRLSNLLDSTPIMTRPRLQDVGTPMINASDTVNYYCWAGSNQVWYGSKLPDSLHFSGAERGSVRMNLDPAYYASHPSLNSYSRLNIGERDAGLVWQEGISRDTGRQVFYTRLWSRVVGTGPAAFRRTDRFLTQGRASGNNPVMIGPIKPYLADSSVLVVGDYQEGLSVNRNLYRFPAIYRHLSDWPIIDAYHKRGILRPVRHKAERIVFERRRRNAVTNAYVDQWSIGRSAFDVYAYTDTVITGNIDTVKTSTNSRIYHTSSALLGPDIAQGEQWGEEYSFPPNYAITADDSCNALTFWERPTTGDLRPRVWHATYGYTFYWLTGDVNATSTPLWIKRTNSIGIVPHLAARFSMVAQPGWRRNRRIFNSEMSNDSTTWTITPMMLSSSEYFFKGEDAQPRIDLCRGFSRNDEENGTGYSTLAPINVEGLSEPLTLRPVFQAHGDDSVVVRYASVWVSIPEVSAVSILSQAMGDLTTNVYIERESDGSRVTIDALNYERDSLERTDEYTIIADDDEKYRFVLEPLTETDYAQEDVRISEDEHTYLAKSTQQRYAGALDLKRMRNLNTQSSEFLLAFPNPASASVTIAYQLSDDSKGTDDKLTLTISSSIGIEMVRLEGMSADALTLDTSLWPQGTYFIKVSNSKSILSRPMTVIH